MLLTAINGVTIMPSIHGTGCILTKSVTVPNPENTEKYRKVFLEYKKIHDALAPIYDAR